MLVPVFSLKLAHKIIPRLLTVGKYDGVHPCLTGGTSGGKVFIHNPHLASNPGSRLGGGRLQSAATSGGASEVSLLNIGQQVTSLAAAVIDGEMTLNAEQPGDVLFVGTQTNLLAYNVEQNTDLFYKDLPDGANVLTVGSVKKGEPRLVYVGGNCSVQGFDSEGKDRFWTVTGDNVTSLAFVDFNLDGNMELVVGSEDYDLRVFRGDELLGEISEVDAITSLFPLDGGSMYGYALANGAVGVYNGLDRVWRAKCKSQPMALFSYDINEDGVKELIVGWANGRVEARSDRTGEVIFKDTLESAVAGIVQADYRMTGNEELICCSVEGEVRGYLPSSKDSQQDSMQQMSGDQEKLSQLSLLKQSLLLELKNFESNEKALKASTEEEKKLLTSGMGAIPAGTTLKTEFSVVLNSESDKVRPHLMLSVQSGNETLIRSVIVFAEGLFEGESFIAHPPLSQVSSEVRVPFYPPKDVPLELHIKALVGYSDSQQYHVFEIARPLPRFALYIPCPLNAEPAPSSSVEFFLTERLARIQSWVNQNFLYNPGEDAVSTPYMEMAYKSLRTNTPLVMKIDPQDSGKVILRTDDMDLAGDVIQSMTEFLGIEDLESVADFPKHMEELKEVLVKVDEYHKVRERLSAQMADDSNLIRSWVIRAEDARLMENWSGMKKSYGQLYDLNRDLIAGYKIRCSNHMELLDYLKVVNQAIQKAGRLRAGKPKSRVVTACRQAIKDNDCDSLVKVIKFGKL